MRTEGERERETATRWLRCVKPAKFTDEKRETEFKERRMENQFDFERWLRRK